MKCCVCQAGALQFLRARSLVDKSVAEKAVWGDEAVNAALDSAKFWVDGLANMMSLSGQWRFHLAPKPEEVPHNFQETEYDDGSWASLPGAKSSFLSRHSLYT